MSTPPGPCKQLQRTRLMVGNISSVPVTFSCLNHLNCSCHSAFKQKVGPSSPAQGAREEERERDRKREHQWSSEIESELKYRAVLARTKQQISKMLFSDCFMMATFKGEMKTLTPPHNPVGRCCIALFSGNAVKVHISCHLLWSAFSATWSNKHPTLAEDRGQRTEDRGQRTTITERFFSPGIIN